MSPPTPAPGASLAKAALPASGLPARILAVLRAHGFITLADLRKPLPTDHKLDPDDRALLARIAAYAAATCAQRPPALNLREWLALFLPARQADAIQLHFAFDDPTASLTRHEMRLRETGFKLGVTRERVRQLLNLALGTLRQALPLQAAEPFYRAATAALQAGGGVLEPAEVAAQAAPIWGGASPVGAFLLLVQLVPGRLIRYRDFFSLYAATAIERAEKALVDRLVAAPGLQSLATLAARLPKAARPAGASDFAPLLRALLRHRTDTLLTLDDRAGLAARDTPELLREVLAANGEMSLRALVAAFNAGLPPACQRGSGFLRAVLLNDSLIRKTAPNRYALPGGLQANLPLDS